jgi:hypothetical protein
MNENFKSGFIFTPYKYIVLSTIFFLLPQYYPSDTINIFDVITFNSLKMA